MAEAKVIELITSAGATLDLPLLQEPTKRNQRLVEIFGSIHDAIVFITRSERLPRRCQDEAALAAIAVIYGYRKRKERS